MGIRDKWFEAELSTLVDEFSEAALRDLHGRGRKSAGTIMWVWALGRVTQWRQIAVREVAGRASECPVRDAALALQAATEAFLEDMYGPYASGPHTAPPTPTGLEVICSDVISDNRPWFAGHGIGVPKRIPRSATFFAYECLAGVRFCAETWYSISTNRARTHWIMWVRIEDIESYGFCTYPLAACPKRGLSRDRAAIYLLRRWWQIFRDTWEGERPMELYNTNVIEGGYFWALVDEIWPEKEDGDEASGQAADND